jgi:integrase
LKAKAGLKDFRFHDIRHTSITTLCESGASEQIAGHVSNRMLERYSHIRLAAKREAIEALSVNTHQVREHHEHRERVNALNTLNVNMNTEAGEIPS